MNATAKLTWAPILLLIVAAAVIALAILLALPATRKQTRHMLGLLVTLAALAAGLLFFFRASASMHIANPPRRAWARSIDEPAREAPEIMHGPAAASDHVESPADAVPPAAAAADSPPLVAEAEIPSGAPVASPKPGWVGSPPQIKENVYQLELASGRFTTYPECQRALDDQLKRTVQEYVVAQFASELGPAPAFAPVSSALIHQLFVKELYLEPVESSVGPMQQLHALVRFDESGRRLLREQYEQAVTQGRLVHLAAGGAMLLVVLGAALAYIRLDMATAGVYRLRLQLGAAALILLSGAGLVLLRWVLPV